MSCRICGSGAVAEIGQVEYYAGFSWPVYDCRDCRCRFTQHDESIYDRMHAQPGSSYGTYRETAERYKGLFERGDVAQLRAELAQIPKFKFIVDAVNGQAPPAKLLEIGCSRGHLTSYFILSGHDITGVDVSAQAVAGARQAFGEHFVTADSPAIARGAPYDVIYHVGTIGCVGDPIGMTRQLLALLRPGGRLLFNAPNADSCCLRGQLWLDAAPPPDLVTLFRSGFWTRYFADVAEVTEQAQSYSKRESFVLGLRGLLGRGWDAPRPIPLEEGFQDFRGPRLVRQNVGVILSGLLERGIVKAASLTRLTELARNRPSPFGLMVSMTRR